MLDKSAVIIVTTLPVAAVLQLLALHHMELISEDACCHCLLVFCIVIEQDFVCGNVCSDSAPKTLNICVCVFLFVFVFFFASSTCACNLGPQDHEYGCIFVSLSVVISGSGPEVMVHQHVFTDDILL